ncbi:MAG: ABC transporter ATP-binding protein [Thiohalomonadales bacterium]
MGITKGYGLGKLGSVISSDEVIRQSSHFSEYAPTNEDLSQCVNNEVALHVSGLTAGYGHMEILHDFNLQIGKGQSLCLIGPNGAGKSTVLHTIYGFCRIFSGTIQKDGQDITRLSSNDKLSMAGIAYLLQDNSVFEQMTVAENLLLGGYLLPSKADAKIATEKVFSKYTRLAQRRHQLAGSLSGGERRLLEISRALIMDPEVLLVDEPSIGLEPRFIDQVFDILKDLQDNENKTIIMVEQNARRGLEFADIGYILVSGKLALAGPASELLDNAQVAELFLGG